MHIVSTESDTLPVLPSNHLDLVLYVALYAALYSMFCTLSCTLYAMSVCMPGASAAPSFSTWRSSDKKKLFKQSQKAPNNGRISATWHAALGIKKPWQTAKSLPLEKSKNGKFLTKYINYVKTNRCRTSCLTPSAYETKWQSQNKEEFPFGLKLRTKANQTFWPEFNIN